MTSPAFSLRQSVYGPMTSCSENLFSIQFVSWCEPAPARIVGLCWSRFISGTAWCSPGPHGPDSVESCGVHTGAVLGQSYVVIYACPVETTSRSKMNVLVAGFTGDDTSRAVILVCLRAQDARHHGRYGPQGIFRTLIPRRSHARCVQRQVPLVLETVQAQFSDKVARARVVLRHVPMVPETVQFFAPGQGY